MEAGGRTGMSSKYIVRQPIKDQANEIIGYEIQ